MWFTMVLHKSLWLKINNPKQVGELWSTVEKLSKAHPHTPVANTQSSSLLWGFSVCGAAEYTEIRCNCEPLSTAGTVDHMKHVASSVDTRQGCASRWMLDLLLLLHGRGWGNETTLDIHRWNKPASVGVPVQNEMLTTGLELEVLFWENRTASTVIHRALQTKRLYFKWSRWISWLTNWLNLRLMSSSICLVPNAEFHVNRKVQLI